VLPADRKRHWALGVLCAALLTSRRISLRLSTRCAKRSYGRQLAEYVRQDGESSTRDARPLALTLGLGLDPRRVVRAARRLPQLRVDRISNPALLDGTLEEPGKTLTTSSAGEGPARCPASNLHNAVRSELVEDRMKSKRNCGSMPTGSAQAKLTTNGKVILTETSPAGRPSVQL
jgi:hypothetical protein